jgi:hypothetical protein
MPDDLPPSTTPTPLPNPSAPDRVSSFDRGCNFVAGAIGGFILFYIGGALALSASRGSSTLAVLYLASAFIVAVACMFKPALRGLAAGIFLGLGCVLLLIAICSGFHIN